MRAPICALLLLSVVALGPAACAGSEQDDPSVPTPTGDGGAGGQASGPEYTTHVCEGAPTAAPGADVCAVQAGDQRMLVVGDVLTPGAVYEGGAVLLDAGGSISCVGCDCFPEAVVSAGLINAHDHVGWMNGEPWVAQQNGVDEDLRWEHRNDWRRGKRNHPEIDVAGGGASKQDKVYGELRFVLSGATAIFGSGDLGGLMRDLDATGDGDSGLGDPGAKYDTFPLGDSSGTQMEQGCGSYDIDGPASSYFDCHAPHVAEGIDQVSRNEFHCLTGTGSGSEAVLDERSAIIHGIGLTVAEIALMAERGMRLIWTPRSNIALYGDTAPVTVYDQLGVSIGLGTDWLPSGSMNMLRELACAAGFNRDFLGGHFSDHALWQMATIGSARALAFDDVVGKLAPSYAGDLAVYAKGDRSHYTAVVDAAVEDVALVLRGGEVLSGNEAVVAALEPSCEPLDVCGVPKQVCLSRDTGETLADLEASINPAYPLFYCGEPAGEPTCLPARTLNEDAVNGSTNYAGMSSADDEDGDGVSQADDNCASVFNPVRPVDNGTQADHDGDGVGDACDPCPLDADTDDCSLIDAPDPGPGPEPTDTTIVAIQDVSHAGHPAEGTRVTVTCVVTAVGDSLAWCQDPAGGAYSGIAVFTGSAATYVGSGDAVAVGDSVQVEGDYVEFFDLSQLDNAAFTFVATATAPAAVSVSVSELISGTVAESYEGVLVRISAVTVSDVNPDAPDDYDEFAVDGLRIDDLIIDGGGTGGTLDNGYSLGHAFSEIVGVHHYSFGNYKLLPRSMNDLN